MDGKVATPAALRGNVRTIPEIDKTLSIEGQCADAKATGDALAVRDATLAEHKATLDSHAATLDNHKGALDSHAAMLDEHKTSIDNNAANAEERINAAENRLENLKERADRLEQDVEEHLMAFDFGIKPKVDGLDVKVQSATAISAKVETVYADYAQSLYLCTVNARFYIEGLFNQEQLLGGLPKPALDPINIVGYAHGSSTCYPFSLRSDGNEGVIYNNYIIQERSLIDLTFTYVTAADSAV